MKKSETIKYLENAKEILKKSPVEENVFTEIKFVKEACGTAYLAVLKAIDDFLFKKDISKKELPRFKKGYDRIIDKYLSIYDVNAVKDYLKQGENFTKKLNRLAT